MWLDVKDESKRYSDPTSLEIIRMYTAAAAASPFDCEEANAVLYPHWKEAWEECKQAFERRHKLEETNKGQVEADFPEFMHMEEKQAKATKKDAWDELKK